MARINEQATAYRRLKQPHYQMIGGIFSVTIRTHDSIPAATIKKLTDRKRQVIQEIEADKLPGKRARKKDIEWRYYLHLEKLTHARRTQEHLFNNPAAAQAVLGRVKAYAGVYYELVAYALLSNHLHLLLDFSIQCPNDWDFVSLIPGYRNLASVIGKIKGGAASDVNKAIGRKGKLWAPGYYDRYIRDQRHFMYEFWYILRNAENAGLVGSFREHPFTFGDPVLLGE